MPSPRKRGSPRKSKTVENTNVVCPEDKEKPSISCETKCEEMSEVDVLNTSINDDEIDLPASNIDVVNTSMNDDEIVLPASTTSGEKTKQKGGESCPEKEKEVIYSSLPPDLNIDSLMRATRTSITGELFVVERVNGSLRITISDKSDTKAHLFDNDADAECVCCSRVIAPLEMYLNFPDDLDRRRLWGNMLGFKYSEMLKLKLGSKSSLACCGVICTDHFSEECFRKFNFNKAAIEAFGIPVPLSPITSLTPSKKRTPWECTICSFRCLSVSDMHFHLLAHVSVGMESSEIRDLLNGKGLACPFCRTCTYGYKTLSGFSRHLILEPTTHFYLKRIYEVAKTNFRSSVLNPASQWISWTERNVYFAYHGCEPPSRTPQKRKLPAGSSNSPMKRSSSSPKDSRGSTDEIHNYACTSSSTLKCDNISIIREGTADDTANVPVVRPIGASMAVRRLIPVEPADKTNAVESSDNQSREMSVAARQNDDRIRIRLQQEHERVASYDRARHVQRRSDSPDMPILYSRMITNTTVPVPVADSGSTIADVLNDVAGDEDRPEEGLALITDTVLSPPIAPVAYDRMHAVRRKTQRQLESNEARLRLFGDVTYVEVPKGYKKVETSKGLRLVSLREKTWEEHLAPTVTIVNRRFLPVKRVDEI